MIRFISSAMEWLSEQCVDALDMSEVNFNTSEHQGMFQTSYHILCRPKDCVPDLQCSGVVCSPNIWLSTSGLLNQLISTLLL